MMKKILVVLVFLTSFVLTNAQELGVRFGYEGVSNVAVDAVFGVSKFSRIHADLAFGSNGVGVDALWDFLYKPLGSESLNWYLGVGPYITIDDPFWLGAAAEAGIEYRFSGAPIALGVDWRPKFSIIETTDLHFDGFGVNLRYVFGKK